LIQTELGYLINERVHKDSNHRHDANSYSIVTSQLEKAHNNQRRSSKLSNL